MPHVPPLPMTCLTCILLLICLLWTLRFKRRQALLPPSAPPPPAPHKNKNKTNDNLSPKVQLLRSKLAIAMGNACPIRDDVKTQQPDALDEPWSGKMSGPPYRHVVLNNKTFAMSELDDGELAARISRQPAIDAGENIKLYLNDVHVRHFERGLGMRPGEMSRMQAAAGVSPHTPGFLFLRHVVSCIILKRDESL